MKTTSLSLNYRSQEKNNEIRETTALPQQRSAWNQNTDLLAGKQ